ncbi:MAG: nucleotide exchange factor GrpE [Marinilabiliales bacterium]
MKTKNNKEDKVENIDINKEVEKSIKPEDTNIKQSEKKQEDNQENNQAQKETKSKKTKKTTTKKIEEIQSQLQELNDKYIRLSAEFDNYRKRTLKEKMELTKSAGESILINILPVMDDFERALENIDKAKDLNAMKDGIKLIYNKFKDFLKQQGVEEIAAKDQKFDTDLHEAVTKFPVEEDKKGTVIDVVQKGYKLNDKIIRFAKVVVGE